MHVHEVDPQVVERTMQRLFEFRRVLRVDRPVNVEWKRHRRIAEFPDPIIEIQTPRQADLVDILPEECRNLPAPHFLSQKPGGSSLGK